MNEFGEYMRNFETKLSFEVEHADSNAEIAFVTANSDHLDWEDDDNHRDQFYLKREVIDQAEYLIGIKTRVDSNTNQTFITKYMLDLKTGLFVTPRECAEGPYYPNKLSSQAEIDVEVGMFKMGQWCPDEQDWDDFMKLIDDAKIHAEILKAQEEMKPKTVEEILAWVALYTHTKEI